MKKHINIIIYGFTGVMFLMIGVISFSLIRAENLSKILENVHLRQNIKSNLVFKMRDGQLKRILSLRNLYLLEDPFDVDKERMLFYSYARSVNDARNELLSFTLFPREKNALDEFIQAARITGPLQNQIVDLILSGDKRRVSTLLKQVYPAQDKAMNALQKFQQSLNLERQDALSSTLKDNDKTTFYIFSLTLLSSLVAIGIIIYIVFITARQTKLIEDERKKFKMLFEKNMDAVVLLRSKKIIEWNYKMQKLFNVKDDTKLNNIELHQLSPLTQDGNHSSETLFTKKITQVTLSNGSTFEWKFERFDGTVFFAEVSLVYFELSEGELHQVVIKDISERKKAEQVMHEQANFDLLTSLPNRSLFRDRLQASVIRAKRFKYKFALLFIDLDRFKYVNDTLGHLAGDKVLQEVAKRLKNKIMQVDTVARLGGDEFTVLLDNITNPVDATYVADAIITEISKPYLIEKTEANIGASIGITIYPDDAESTEALLSNADMAMYQAKQSGRNKHHFFTPELDIASKNRIELEQDLIRAVEYNQFELYFQPIINITHKKVVCAEALIRWKHPEKGIVPPIDFIPMAEEIGLIKPLSHWILNAACKQLNDLKEMGLGDICLSINLPASEKLSGMNREFIRETTKAHQVSTSQLIFEITESLLMDNTESSIAWLNDIRDLGIRISIDDFGTGYSSLSYLKQFPIDTLKIDRSFIQDITNDSNDQSLVDAIVAIANSLKLSLVAEGVETTEQLTYLQKHQSNCSLIQGFLFSKPLIKQEFETFIKNFKMA